MTVISKWLELLTDSPLFSITATVTLTLIFIHLSAFLYQFLKKHLFLFWTRGKVITIDSYKKIMIKIFCKAQFLNGFEVIPLDPIKHKRRLVTSKTEGFLIKCLCHDDFIKQSGCYEPITTRSGFHSIYNSSVFETKEEAEGYLLDNIESCGYDKVVLMILGAGTVLSFVALLLDVLITRYPMLVLVVGLIAAVVSMVLFGGRFIFDATEKFKQLEKVLKDGKE